MGRIPERAAQAWRRLGDERGTLYEIPILIFLLAISLAVGFGQYGRYGWKGVLLGAVITLAGVVGAFFALMGIVAGSARLNERLEKHSWYLPLRSLLKSTLLFLFFSFWGALFGLICVGLFELFERVPEWVYWAMALTAGGIWMILRRHFKDAFWPLFWHVSGFLGLGGLCVVLGMFIGPLFFNNPSALMRLLQIVFFVPSIVYIAFLVMKSPKPSGDDQGH